MKLAVLCQTRCFDSTSSAGTCPSSLHEDPHIRFHSSISGSSQTKRYIAALSNIYSRKLEYTQQVLGKYIEQRSRQQWSLRDLIAYIRIATVRNGIEAYKEVGGIGSITSH